MCKYLPLLLLIPFLLSCEQDEQAALPADVPEITFQDLTFRHGVSDNVLTSPDTLKVTIAFKDGGTDLGYSSTDQSFPYLYYYFKNGQLETSTDVDRPDLLKIGASDTLPAYSCHNYMIRNFRQPADTVYMQHNPYFYNFRVDLYIKENGSFSLYDFVGSNPYCYSALHGRFQLLPLLTAVDGSLYIRDQGQGFDILMKDSYSGEITYNMTTYWKNIFKGKTIKLKLRILDRKGNFSNEAESTEMLIPQ